MVPNKLNKNSPVAYLFDVDGVLTDPVERKVTEESLYDEIINRLARGEPVGLNTGRSTAWMKERFITPLLERAEDKSILSNFVAIGEKGGAWITFDDKGRMHHGRASEISMPEDLKEKVRELIDNDYSDSMFFDDTKETMISTEMIDGYDLNDYHQRQKDLIKNLEKILEELGRNYKIDPTTIGTDIENPHVGKFLGAERFLKFLEDKNIKPDRFIAFGDSKSDFEMSDELQRRGRKVEMIYVGDREKLGESIREYPIEYVGGYSHGTLEYLKRTD